MSRPSFRILVRHCNRILLKWFFFYLAIGLPAVGTALNAQDGRAYLEHYENAIQAYKQEDYPAFHRNINEAHLAAPHHLGISFYYAAANALTNNVEEALRVLETLSRLGVDYGVGQSETFKVLQKEPRFTRLIETLEARTKPTANSKVAIRLAEKDLLTEGVAFDLKTGSFFISSVHKSKIVKVSENGEVVDFIAEGQDGVAGILALQVDSARRWLWATTVSLPQTRKRSTADHGKTGIFKYDLDTGRLLQSFFVADTSRAHNLNDLVISSRGSVFITDAASFELFRILPEGDDLELFLESGLIPTAQGLALSPDERFLFVSSYRDGVYRVELATRRISRLEHPEDMTMYGIDGLYFYDGSLLAIHNGLSPHRVNRYFLNEDCSQVTGFEVLEMANANFNEPTLGVVVNDDFYYIANSQWEAFSSDGSTPPLDQLSEPIILRIKLK